MRQLLKEIYNVMSLECGMKKMKPVSFGGFEQIHIIVNKLPNVKHYEANELILS